jgi:type I restriction enzyme S subunit
METMPPKRKLGELVTFKTGKLDSNAAVPNGMYPFFTCSQETLRTNTFSFDDECVLLAGNNANGIFPLKHYKGKFDAYQRTYVVRPRNADMLTTRFLYYALRLKLDEFRSFSTGAATKFLTLTILNETEIQAPPLPIQRRIAGILSAYDDLIENSQRRIKILEEMARRLYREWFVYFRFPGHEDCGLVESPLGEIPEGWEVKLVEEIVKRIPVGKKYDQKTVASNGAVPVFDQGKTGIIGFHDDEPGVVASETAPVIVFANHTCYQRLIHIPFSAIQNVLPFVPSPVLSRNIYWLHWATNGLVVFNDYKGHWPEFAAKDLIVPPAAFCQRFGEFAAPLSQQILKLERQIHNLRRTRDLLLPRLLSGQIDVESLSDPAISHS